MKINASLHSLPHFSHHFECRYQRRVLASKLNAVLFWHELYLILIFLQCLKEVKILECRHANAILQLREKWSNASIFSPNSFSVASAWAAGLEKKKKKLKVKKEFLKDDKVQKKWSFSPIGKWLWPKDWTIFRTNTLC